MESGLSSRGKSYQDSLHCEFSNDIVWEERGNTETCEMNYVTVANYARRFLVQPAANEDLE